MGKLLNPMLINNNGNKNDKYEKIFRGFIIFFLHYWAKFTICLVPSGCLKMLLCTKWDVSLLNE